VDNEEIKNHEAELEEMARERLGNKYNGSESPVWNVGYWLGTRRYTTDQGSVVRY
jgi:hypothetical protein